MMRMEKLTDWLTDWLTHSLFLCVCVCVKEGWGAGLRMCIRYTISCHYDLMALITYVCFGAVCKSNKWQLVHRDGLDTDAFPRRPQIQTSITCFHSPSPSCAAAFINLDRSLSLSRSVARVSPSGVWMRPGFCGRREGSDVLWTLGLMDRFVIIDSEPFMLAPLSRGRPDVCVCVYVCVCVCDATVVWCQQ